MFRLVKKLLLICRSKNRITLTFEGHVVSLDTNRAVASKNLASLLCFMFPGGVDVEDVDTDLWNEMQAS
jgi:hypothetical protein